MQWTTNEREFILALAHNTTRQWGREMILSKGQPTTDEDLQKAMEIGSQAGMAAAASAAEVVAKKWPRKELSTVQERWAANDRQAALLLIVRTGLQQGRALLAQELGQPEEDLADGEELTSILDAEVQQLKEGGQWRKLAGEPGEGETDLVTLLNARSEEERRILFLQDIERDALSEKDWEKEYPVPPTWGGKGEAGPDGQRRATLKDIFDFYGTRLDALQTAAAEIAVGDRLKEHSANAREIADSIKIVDVILSEVNLSLKGDPGTVIIKQMSDGHPTPEGILFKGQFLARTAVALWAVKSHIADWRLGRCEYHPCSRFFIGKNSSQKYCSSGCREKTSRYGAKDQKRKSPGPGRPRKKTTTGGIAENFNL